MEICIFDLMDYLAVLLLTFLLSFLFYKLKLNHIWLGYIIIAALDYAIYFVKCYGYYLNQNKFGVGFYLFLGLDTFIKYLLLSLAVLIILNYFTYRRFFYIPDSKKGIPSDVIDDIF